MAIETRSYSDFTTQMRALTGSSFSIGVSTEMASQWEAAFNSNLSNVWQQFPWQDICPYGEARFVGNNLTYPNDLSKTANWTATALTITGENFKNPLDNRTTASKVLETGATSAHSVAQASVAITVGTTYNFSAYVRPNGRSWVYLKFNDGISDYTAFYNVTTGATGTVAGTGATATIGEMPLGYYLCALSFETDAAATATGTATVQLSTDGSTLSYAGDTAKGLYVWGALLQATTNTGVGDSLVAFDQTGEDEMETVFQVWQDSPFNANTPRPVGYDLTRDGIQIISGAWSSYPTVNSSGVTITAPQANPVYVYYRKRMPNFTGDTYVSADSYSVDDTVYFSDSDEVGNYWKCVSAASAGDTPETDPDKWDVLEIPDSFFRATVWFCYGDFLTSDGQGDKAMSAYQLAQKKLDDALERETRQQARDGLPLRVSTHMTAQLRSW